MDNKKKITYVEKIEKFVYHVRGQQVMFDYDLATIYGYEVKYLNRQVKRNIERFPEDFMFQITKEELEEMRCQNVTTKFSSMSRTLPYAFTEQGIYMLATVLKSELAIKQSISIMRTFKNMRHYFIKNRQFVNKKELKQITLSLSQYQNKTDKTIQTIEKRIDELSSNFISNSELKNLIIYKGQKFEADKAYIDIYQKANKKIYIIDNYVNIKTLHLLSHKKTNVEVIVFTENIRGRNGILTSSEIEDFNKEYPLLHIKPNPDCHDRFVILDYDLENEKVYHCGASSKDAGNKVCAINKIEDVSLIHPIINSLLLNSDKII